MAHHEHPQKQSRFQVLNHTEEEENAYDIVAQRNMPKPCSVFASIMHMVKGSLGGGILSGHEGYKIAGVGVALPLTVILGIYMTWCLHLLVWSTQMLCRRTRVPSMSYADVGEASCACFPREKVRKLAKPFRYLIDSLICLDLFGACATYQIIISRTAKQLVENVQESHLHGVGNYPHLRVYLAIFMIPVVLICLIRHLKVLAPFSMGANCLILICIAVTIYYAFENNPRCENMVMAKTFYGAFQFIGTIVYSISCAGVVIAIENNMKNPERFPKALVIGMIMTTLAMVATSFFGYMGYLEKSTSPLTVNFPLTIVPKIIKGLMAVMIVVTHALNFWVPFNLCWWYLQKLHKGKNLVFWELVYRALIVITIAIVAIIFPSIIALIGFLGTFCLANIAFVWPIQIYLLTIWYRPGLGAYMYRLWWGLFLLVIGIILLVAGSIVNAAELVTVFVEVNVKNKK